jgi:kinase-associated protein B
MTEGRLIVGDRVSAAYKTGEYIGEIIDISPPRALVKILAVLKHPTQGDLHNPFEVDVPIFHQRRALSYQEKAWVPLSTISLLNGDVPSYSESLKKALEAEIEMLQRTTGAERWVQRSLEELESLKKEYFPFLD